MPLIYHITTQAGWDEATAAGRVVADSLVTEGFIHCSRQTQLLAVADRFFAGAESLLVLAIDEAAVMPWLKNEGPAAADDPFAANLFPHVYGPIPVAAVIAVAPLSAADDGHFVWPVGLRRDT